MAGKVQVPVRLYHKYLGLKCVYLNSRVMIIYLLPCKVMVVGKSILTGAASEYVVIKVSTNSTRPVPLEISCRFGHGGKSGEGRSHEETWLPGCRHYHCSSEREEGKESDHATWKSIETEDPMQAETRCRILKTGAGTCPCFHSTLVPQLVIAG